MAGAQGFALWLLRKGWGPNNPSKVKLPKTKLPPVMSKLLTVPSFPNNTTGLEPSLFKKWNLGEGVSQNKTVKQKQRILFFSHSEKGFERTPVWAYSG